MSGEEANRPAQWKIRQMITANNMLVLAQSYANNGGRFDLAYVYANEACEIVSRLPSSENMVSTAMRVRQSALEGVVSAAKGSREAKREGVKGGGENEVVSRPETTEEEAETLQQWEVGQAEAAMKLAMQSISYAEEQGRFDLAYVYANEAYEIFSLLQSSNSEVLATATAAMVFRQCALHQLVPAAKRWEEAKQRVEYSDNELISILNRARNTSALNHSAYPSHVEVSSLDIFWDLRREPPRMICVLERQDKSVVEPAVGFFDLPEFFASHTGAGFSLDDLNIYFSPDEGVPPGDEHFRLLLQLASEQCRPTIFSAMTRVLVSGSDFRNVTAATFKELFGEVLTALRYHFLNLRQLPEGVEPAELLLYPTLLASQMVIFSMSPRAHWPAMWRARSNPPVIKFPIASILAHLKGKAAAISGRDTTIVADVAESRNTLQQLIIYDAYLAEEEGGVEALVEAIKQDFFKPAAIRLAEEGDQTKKEKSHSYPFSLYITYRHATAFDLRHGGEWHNSLGEKLRVRATALCSSEQLAEPEEYHIEVRRSSE